MPSHYMNPFDLGAGPGSGVMLPPQVPYAPTAVGGPMAGQMGAGPPGPDLTRGSIPPTTMGGIGQGIQNAASGFGDWARNAWDVYRDPSDQRKKIAMAMMGMGQGLLSKQPGESFAPGLSRGIQAGTQGYLQQGKRNRAERFRESVMANENIPMEMREALAGGDPSQMQMLTSMYGTNVGAASAEARNRTSIQASEAAARRSQSKEDRRIYEDERDVAIKLGKEQSVRIYDAITQVLSGNPEAMEPLKEVFPDWDFEKWADEGVVPPGAHAFMKLSMDMYGGRRERQADRAHGGGGARGGGLVE